MYLGPYYVLVKTLSRPPNDQAALTDQSEICMPVPSRVCLHVAYVCPFNDHTGGISDACAISCDHLPHWHDQSLLAADIMKGVQVCLLLVRSCKARPERPLILLLSLQLRSLLWDADQAVRDEVSRANALVCKIL